MKQEIFGSAAELAKNESAFVLFVEGNADGNERRAMLLGVSRDSQRYLLDSEGNHPEFTFQVPQDDPEMVTLGWPNGQFLRLPVDSDSYLEISFKTLAAFTDAQAALDWYERRFGRILSPFSRFYGEGAPQVIPYNGQM